MRFVISVFDSELHLLQACHQNMLPLPVKPSYALHLSVLHFLLFCIPVLQILYSYAVRDFLRNYSEPGETDLKTT